ncbi:adhesin, partial [Lacihabitans sp. LS3-19]|uniref:SprB repeat-containing protein n=1 Tax=Lacihabitans sp. LS3-19 TaxID=2487335 RepID=UPI0020CF5290
ISTTITQPAAALARSLTQTNVLCFGNSTGVVTVAGSGGTSPYTYQLGIGTYQASGTFSGLAAGTYTVNVKDANGCITPQSVTITQPAIALSASISSTTDVLCKGDATGAATVLASNGTAGYTYLWSDGQTTATATGLIAGSYSVTVTDANGCKVEDIPATIIEPAIALSAIVTDYILSCSETSGTINLSISGGTPGYTFDWDNDGTGDYNDSQNLTTVAGNYNVVIRDANGCEYLSSGQIIFTPCPELSIVKVQSAGENPITAPGTLNYT